MTKNNNIWRKVFYFLITISVLLYIGMNVEGFIIIEKKAEVLFKYTFSAIIALAFFISLKLEKITRKEIWFYIPFAIFIFIYTFNVVSLKDIPISMIANYIIFFMIMRIFSVISLRKRLFSLLIVPLVILLPFYAFNILDFIYVNNLNNTGAMLFFLTYFLLAFIAYVNMSLNKKIKEEGSDFEKSEENVRKRKTSIKIYNLLYIFLIPLIYLIFKTNTRSIILAILAGVFTFLIWNVITKNKKRFKTYFGIVIVGSLLLSIIYPISSKIEVFQHISSLMQNVLGKALYTGREVAWINVIDKVVSQNVLLGLGSNVNVNALTGIGLSAHNTYLQVFAQTGLIGLTVFLVMLYNIALKMYENRDNKISKLSFIFFIGTIVYMNFDVNLLQLNFGLAILQWTIFGLGINTRGFRRSVSKNVNNKKVLTLIILGTIFSLIYVGYIYTGLKENKNEIVLKKYFSEVESLRNSKNIKINIRKDIDEENDRFIINYFNFDRNGNVIFVRTTENINMYFDLRKKQLLTLDYKNMIHTTRKLKDYETEKYIYEKYFPIPLYNEKEKLLANYKEVDIDTEQELNIFDKTRTTTTILNKKENITEKVYLGSVFLTPVKSEELDLKTGDIKSYAFGIQKDIFLEPFYNRREKIEEFEHKREWFNKKKINLRLGLQELQKVFLKKLEKFYR